MRTASRFAVIAAILLVAGIVIEKSHHATNQKSLSQTAIRIAESLQHTQQGRLRASESLNFQVDIDLTVIEHDKWCARASETAEVRKLRREASAAREALDKKAQLSRVWIREFAELLVQPDILPARQYAESKQHNASNSELTALALLQVVTQVMALDFDGAQQALSSLTHNLPDTDETTSRIASLRQSIQKKQASYSAFIHDSAKLVARRLRDAQFAVAKSELDTAQKQFAGTNPTLTSMAVFISCIETSQFSQAKSIIQTIPTPQLDANGSQAVIIELSESIEFACNVSTQSMAEVTSAVERFLSEEKYSEARQYLAPTLEHQALPAEAQGILLQFVDQFEKGDLPSVDRTLKSFENIVPEGITTTVVVRPLRDVIAKANQAIETAKREETQKTVNTVREALEYAKKGQFNKSKELLDGINSPSNHATVAAISTFLERVAVQDFAEAETRLKSIPTTLADGSSAQELRSLVTGVLTDERNANKNKQASIAKQVKTIVQNSGKPYQAAPKTPALKLRGRAMVWDFTKDDIEKAYELLPDDLRASSRDGVITMFCILKRTNVKVGTYSISGQPAYQEHMQIAVVYWPSKQYGGEGEILGGSPPGVRVVKATPEYGSSVKIKEWIEKLPRDKLPSKSTVAAAPNPAREKTAKTILVTAKNLLKTNSPNARMTGKAKLQQIIDKYPETEAATEAMDLLDGGT